MHYTAVKPPRFSFVFLVLTNQQFLPLLSLVSLTTATPVAATRVSVSVNVYADTACAVPDVEGYSFTKNNQCQQFIEQEGSITATSKNAVPEGCVLQVFGDTDCQDVFAAITINGGCETPLLGPVSSGKLVGC